jgi:hypothetical protein
MRGTSWIQNLLRHIFPKRSGEDYKVETDPSYFRKIMEQDERNRRLFPSRKQRMKAANRKAMVG